MTKSEMIVKISQEMGMQQTIVKQVVQMTLDGMIDCLASEGNLELRHFGVFTVKTRKARKARNPRTGVPAIVPERQVVTFKPGKAAKARIAAIVTKPAADSAQNQV